MRPAGRVRGIRVCWWDPIVSPVIFIFHIPVASIVDEARILIRIVIFCHFVLSLQVEFRSRILP